MKEGIHPNYRDVCFVDLSNGFKFVTRSCAQTRETITMEDGRELPLFKVETTSESHPFYTARRRAWTPWAAASRSSATSSPRVGIKK
jgi:large subunit ribosomal protein L31